MSANISMDRLCQRMRSLVHDCLAKHLYDSAIFYADKLMTMSNGAAADVYTLAEVIQKALYPIVFPNFLVNDVADSSNTDHGLSNQTDDVDKPQRVMIEYHLFVSYNAAGIVHGEAVAQSPRLTSQCRPHRG